MSEAYITYERRIVKVESDESIALCRNREEAQKYATILNSQDALVAVCKTAASEISLLLPYLSGMYKSNMTQMRNEIRAALARAEGK